MLIAGIILRVSATIDDQAAIRDEAGSYMGIDR